MASKNMEMRFMVSVWNKPKIDLPRGYFVTLADDAPTLLIVPSLTRKPETFEARKIFWRLYRWEAKDIQSPHVLTEATPQQGMTV